MWGQAAPKGSAKAFPNGQPLSDGIPHGRDALVSLYKELAMASNKGHAKNGC